MNRILAILLIITLALPVCAKRHQTEDIITPQVQLEKRKFQTRTYKTKDAAQIMKAILNVLQDEGYIVYNVNSLLGFVYAVKDFDTTDHNIDISKEFGFSKSRLNYNGVKVATIETSANVTQYGDILRVRINFKRKLLNEYGNAQFIDDVSESEFYDSFYEKLSTALSLHDEITNTEEKNQETEANSNHNTNEAIVGPELLKEINNEIDKIMNSEVPTIQVVSVQKEQQSEKKQEIENSIPKEQINEKQETLEVKSKQEETQEEKQNETEEMVKEQTNEPAQEITSETNATDNAEINEKEEITEEQIPQKEKKIKKKKDKNNTKKEIIEEKTSVTQEQNTAEEAKNEEE